MAPRIVEIGGFTHIVRNSEDVICNTATSDAADDLGDESMRWLDTDSTVVTCPDCTDIARLCRGARFQEKL